MENIREELLSLAEADYAAFALRLLPSGTKLMGVRLPKLRKIARRLAATKQGRAFAAQNHKGEFFEEKMLRGMLIGALKVSTAERISLIRKFLPQIDNWSVCDSFCSSIKIPQADRPNFLEFLKVCMSSCSEFEYRFGAVMLKCLYLDEVYICESLRLLSAECPGKYYAQSGAAWAICEAYIKFPEKTRMLFDGGALSRNVKSLALRKIRESLRT